MSKSVFPCFHNSENIEKTPQNEREALSAVQQHELSHRRRGLVLLLEGHASLICAAVLPALFIPTVAVWNCPLSGSLCADIL